MPNKYSIEVYYQVPKRKSGVFDSICEKKINSDMPFFMIEKFHTY